MPETRDLTKTDITPTPAKRNNASLTVMIKEETKNRELLTKFIKDHMKLGTDYGPIKMGGKDSKDCLFKPGSEKFVSLMKLRIRFRKDVDTWEMAGSSNGLFCYIAELVDRNDQVVGEGRGSCSASEKQNNINTAIKIAEKRAQIDAVLRTGGLSDFFTQDLDDMEPSTPVATKPQPAKPVEPEPMLPAQGDRITQLLLEKGRTPEELSDYVLRAFRLNDWMKMDRNQAAVTIQKLSSVPTPARSSAEEVADEVAEAMKWNTIATLW